MRLATQVLEIYCNSLRKLRWAPSLGLLSDFSGKLEEPCWARALRSPDHSWPAQALDRFSERRKEDLSKMEIPFLLLTPHEADSKAAGRRARDFLVRCVGDALGSPRPPRGRS